MNRSIRGLANSLAVHQFHRTPRYQERILWLVDQAAAVLAGVGIVDFFAHHGDALHVFGIPAVATGVLVLAVSDPGAIADGGKSQKRQACDGDAEREDDDESCAREDDLVD